jgi:hypothetical protein
VDAQVPPTVDPVDVDRLSSLLALQEITELDTGGDMRRFLVEYLTRFLIQAVLVHGLTGCTPRTAEPVLCQVSKAWTLAPDREEARRRVVVSCNPQLPEPITE